MAKGTPLEAGRPAAARARLRQGGRRGRNRASQRDAGGRATRPAGPDSGPPPAPGDWVRLAVIGPPRGVAGALWLTCFNEKPAEIAAFNPLFAGRGGVALELRVIEVLPPRPHRADRVVAKIAGIEDRTAAAALAGTPLFVPRARLAIPAEGEFYRHDLVGLAVEDLAGQALGTVSAVLDYGAGDVLEIAQGSGRPSILLPFTHDNVPVVDLEGRRMVADPPQGAVP